MHVTKTVKEIPFQVGSGADSKQPYFFAALPGSDLSAQVCKSRESSYTTGELQNSFLPRKKHKVWKNTVPWKRMMATLQGLHAVFVDVLSAPTPYLRPLLQ